MLVTLLVFDLAWEVTASFFSPLYLHFLQQHPVTYISLYKLLLASQSWYPFPAYFERGVAVPAISALAVKTSVCRDSQPKRMRVIMLSNELERISIAAPG